MLVDAPCSGLGTLSRNPDLKWRQSPKAVEELTAKQASILDSSARLVKAGGRLVYATCSVLPQENEAVARAFELAHPEFEPLSVADLLAVAQVGEAASLCSPDGLHMRLWPHRHGTDGFFAGPEFTVVLFDAFQHALDAAGLCIQPGNTQTERNSQEYLFHCSLCC